MTPEQNLLIRQFYVEVANDESIFAGKNTTQKAVKGMCLDLLGYVLIKGKYVPVEKFKGASLTYGQQADYQCSWESDTRAIEELINETNNSKSSSTASSSEPTENTEIREAVLREDV